MNIIEAYIDDLLDCFPVNRITQKMRLDLLEATSKDLEVLESQGKDEQEASAMIITKIAPAKTLATMIPNSHALSYFLILAIGLTVGFAAFVITSQPDFLQIFLPARMEFPLIIAQYIQYLVICVLVYAFVYLFYRLLPQKYISRTPRQASISLYLGTIMAALYFSISIAFIIFSFNGYLDEDINIFFRSFYHIFIQNNVMAYVYACVNALLFVSGRNNYHLNKKSAPYEFNRIYSHPYHDIVMNDKTEVEVVVDPVTEVSEEITKEEINQTSDIEPGQDMISEKDKPVISEKDSVIQPVETTEDKLEENNEILKVEKTNDETEAADDSDMEIHEEKDEKPSAHHTDSTSTAPDEILEEANDIEDDFSLSTENSSESEAPSQDETSTVNTFEAIEENTTENIAFSQIDYSNETVSEKKDDNSEIVDTLDEVTPDFQTSSLEKISPNSNRSKKQNQAKKQIASQKPKKKKIQLANNNHYKKKC